MILSRSLLMVLVVLLTVTAGCTVTSLATPSEGPAARTAMPMPETVPPPMVQGDGCTDTVCSALPPQSPAQDGGLFRIDATPLRYSPLLSSTPGIRMSLNRSRMPSATVEYVWNASYGTFLSWDEPDYTVHHLGPMTINRGEPLYWTYTDSPELVKEPVLVTVTARDPLTQSVTGTAQLTLDRDGETAVIVRNGHR